MNSSSESSSTSIRDCWKCNLAVTNPAVAANTAIDAAKATVDLGQKGNSRVVRLELLRSKTEKLIDFYLIEMLVNGSTEHRIVLMDGSVIKPRLKQVGK